MTRESEAGAPGESPSLPSFAFSTDIGASLFIVAEHVSAIHSTLREAGRQLCFLHEACLLSMR